MATCNTCKQMIFGGKRWENQRFCSDRCLETAWRLRQAQALPSEAVATALQGIHQGPCPVCRSSGPNDVHTSYEVWSFFIISSWKRIPRISCRSCGLKRQLGGLFFSLLAGWWGPVGFVLAPLQIVRNIVAMVRPPEPSKASPQLEEHVRLILVEDALAHQKELQSVS